VAREKSKMPCNRKGLLHIFDAAGFSASGFSRLSKETAFRLELLWVVIGLSFLVYLQATLLKFVAFVVLALVLLAVEALNTAIEEIVDHISPDWSQMGKHAKDCGSAAVSFLLVAMAVLLLVIAYENVGM
jgi:diacylglycerol kinase (ATP)